MQVTSENMAVQNISATADIETQVHPIKQDPRVPGGSILTYPM